MSDEDFKRTLIAKHISFDDLGGFFKASVDHYAKTGKPSGSLFMSIKNLMEEYAKSQYNQALEDIMNKVQVIKSNSSDNDDEWFALQSVIEEIEKARISTGL